MKKAYKITIGSLLGLAIFATGTFTGANSDWKSSAINKASSEIGATGYAKKTAMINTMDENIQKTIDAEVAAEIEKQKLDLQRLLDEYYKMKLEGMVDTAQFAELEKQIEAIKVSVYERYKKEIETAFSKK